MMVAESRKIVQVGGGWAGGGGALIRQVSRGEAKRAAD